MRLLIVLLLLSGCKEIHHYHEKPAPTPPGPEPLEKAFTIEYENVTIEGVVEDASLLAIEKARVETVLKLIP